MLSLNHLTVWNQFYFQYMTIAFYHCTHGYE